MERAYLASTRVLSAMLILVGVAMVVVALAGGGGVLALGVVLGTLLALLGAGRLYLARPRANAGVPDGEETAEGARGRAR